MSAQVLQDWDALLARYLADRQSTRKSPRTVEGLKSRLRMFVGWCAERALTAPREVTRKDLKAYRRSLNNYRNPHSGQPLGSGALRNYLSAVKGFFRWLVDEELAPFSPAAEMEMPKVGLRLPKALLTDAEITAICNQASLGGDDLAYRDRTLIETLYAAVPRREELANLDVTDVDLFERTLLIRKGKCDKDRLLPLTERCLPWLEHYLNEVRPRLVGSNESERALFVTHRGERFAPSALGDRVGKIVRAAGISKPKPCHIFRHTVATRMLNNGAKLSFVQQFLGHADIKTTQMYIHLSTDELRDVCDRTHPANGSPKASGKGLRPR